VSLDYGTHGSILDVLPRLPPGIGDLGFGQFSGIFGGFPVQFGFPMGFPTVVIGTPGGGFGGPFTPPPLVPPVFGPASQGQTVPSPPPGGVIPVPEQTVFSEGEDVTDWGGVVTTLGGQLIGSIFGETGGSLLAGGPTAPILGATTSVEPGVFGETVTIDNATGQVIKKCKRRRRRRRLLTPTDLADLASLKAIAGGGQAFNFAVTKAIRR